VTQANARGPAAITWTLFNLSLIIPMLLYRLIYHEALSPLRWALGILQGPPPTRAAAW
jgi:hypothetical protein